MICGLLQIINLLQQATFCLLSDKPAPGNLLHMLTCSMSNWPHQLLRLLGTRNVTSLLHHFSRRAFDNFLELAFSHADFRIHCLLWQSRNQPLVEVDVITHWSAPFSGPTGRLSALKKLHCFLRCKNYITIK